MRKTCSGLGSSPVHAPPQLGNLAEVTELLCASVPSLRNGAKTPPLIVAWEDYFKKPKRSVAKKRFSQFLPHSNYSYSSCDGRGGGSDGYS